MVQMIDAHAGEKARFVPRARGHLTEQCDRARVENLQHCAESGRATENLLIAGRAIRSLDAVSRTTADEIDKRVQVGGNVSLSERAIKQLTGFSDERFSNAILLASRSLTDENDFGIERPAIENVVQRKGTDRALRASLPRLDERLHSLLVGHGFPFLLFT